MGMNVRHRPLVYFDANPLMYAFESRPELSDPIRPLIQALRAKPGAAVTSELVLAELLAPIKRPGAKPQNVRRRIYFDLLIWSRIFDLRPITRDILIETADLRRFIKLKLSDAIHMVTAIQAGCTFFLSNDDDTCRTPEGLRHVKPDAEGVQMILGQIS